MHCIREALHENVLILPDKRSQTHTHTHQPTQTNIFDG